MKCGVCQGLVHRGVLWAKEEGFIWFDRCISCGRYTWLDHEPARWVDGRSIARLPILRPKKKKGSTN